MVSCKTNDKLYIAMENTITENLLGFLHLTFKPNNPVHNSILSSKIKYIPSVVVPEGVVDPAVMALFTKQYLLL